MTKTIHITRTKKTELIFKWLEEKGKSTGEGVSTCVVRMLKNAMENENEN